MPSSPWSRSRRSGGHCHSAHGAAVLATNFTVPFVLACSCHTVLDERGREGLHVQLIRKTLPNDCVRRDFVLAAILRVVSEEFRWLSKWRRNEHLHKSHETGERGGPTGKELHTAHIAWLTWRSLRLHAGLGPISLPVSCGAQKDGNCTVRQTAEGIEYVWYDLGGREHAEPLFRLKGTEASRIFFRRLASYGSGRSLPERKAEKKVENSSCRKSVRVADWSVMNNPLREYFQMAR